jgi:hypothetical protein
MKFENLKQLPGSKNCVAVTAAMITGTTPEEFQNFIGKEAPYTDLDCYRYLLHKGYIVGLGLIVEDEIADEPYTIHSKNQKMDLTFRVKEYPAYVVVRSFRNPEWTHAIYWDGKQFWDPNPDIDDNDQPMNDYEILRWFPVHKISEN